MAADLSMNPDPNAVVPPTVESMITVLKAAAAIPTIKRVVLTSSSIAAFKPAPNKVMIVDQTFWNEEDLAEAWKPPPYTESRAFSVYAAAKIESERAAWKFVSENETPYTMNAVLPTFTFGLILGKLQSGSTAGAIKGLYEGDERMTKFLLGLPPQCHVDVRDAAAIHIAATIYADINGRRLFAFAEPFNFSRTIQTLKEIDPSWVPPQGQGVEGQDLCEIETKPAEDLLRRMGRDGFISYDQTLTDQFSFEQL